MALYITKSVNGQVQKLRVSPTKALYRGYWAIIVGGFAGTSVTCNGVTKFIGSSERVAFNIITPGTYTFTATRQGTTITKKVTLNDDTQEYIINLSMFIGMQQIEYIESTGTQYIDTGVVYSDVLNARLELDAIMFDASTSVRGIGRSGSYFGGPFVGLQSDGKFGYSAGTGDQTTGVTGSSNERYKYDLNIPASTYIVKDANNNVLVNVTNITKSTRSETPSCILFGYYGNPNTGDGPYKLRSMKIYSCKIYDNGVLVRDFIPIKDDTNHGALYDKITQQIFYNSGTGDFICGPNKSYTRIQYLESTGTQYIDTGFKPNNNTRIVVDVKVTNFREVSAGLNLVYGTRTSGVKKFELFICSKDVPNSFRTDYDDNTENVTTSKSLYNLRVVVDKNKNRTTIYEGSTLLSTQYFEPKTFVANNSLFLFMNNIDGVASTQSFIQMFSCKIYDNDTLVRDFIPVLDYDGTPCMLDQVEGKLYYNQGTGEFIAGCLPAEYEELEYIQGYTGNSSVDPSIKAAYIDTGIIFDTTVNMYYKGGIGVFNANSILAFGARPSNAYSGMSSYFSGSDAVTDWGGTDSSGRWTLPLALVAGDTFEVSTYNKTMTISKNGVVAGTNTFTGTATNGLSFYLNSRHDTGGVPSQSSPSVCRLYCFTVTGVCDMIPARKRSNGHIGMYDLVRRQFFENAGEGQFIAGPEKQ